MGKRDKTFKEYVADIVDYHGIETSKIIAIEELSELQKEITKDLRGKFRKEFFMEELADVYIVMESLMQMYDVRTEEFHEYLCDKMQRNLTRIKNDAELREVMKNVVGKGGGTIL